MVKDACPSPTWTVNLQQFHLAGQEIWWAYAEPGVEDQPDYDQRVAARVNVKLPSWDRALLRLHETLRAAYPRAEVDTPSPS